MEDGPAGFCSPRKAISVGTPRIWKRAAIVGLRSVSSFPTSNSPAWRDIDETAASAAREPSTRAVNMNQLGIALTELDAPRVVTRNTHGTGCTLSAAIAALRPQRDSWVAAVRDAKTYLTGALVAADELTIGSGHGPVHHFWQLWADQT